MKASLRAQFAPVVISPMVKGCLLSKFVLAGLLRALDRASAPTVTLATILVQALPLAPMLALQVSCTFFCFLQFVLTSPNVHRTQKFVTS